MAEDGGGFDAAKKGLGEVRQQSKWIDQQVGAGKLRLDPEAAEKAAKVCRDEKDAFRDLLSDSWAIERVQGLGDYPDGTALQERFAQKASDSETGAIALLSQMQDELEKLAKSFESAAKDYRTTDEQAADDFERGMRQ